MSMQNCSLIFLLFRENKDLAFNSYEILCRIFSKNTKKKMSSAAVVLGISMHKLWIFT